MSETPFVQVGDPVSPGEAGFLQHEFDQRSITVRLLIESQRADAVRVMVRAADLDRAIELRRELLGEEEPAPPRTGRAKAWLATGVSFAGALYLARPLPSAVRGLVGLAVAAVVFLACTATADEPPPPYVQEEEHRD